MEASGSLKNQADNTKTIAYTVSDGSGAFERAQYQAVGDSTALTIDIDQAAWDMAFAGSYTDTVTFIVSYMDTTAHS